MLISPFWSDVYKTGVEQIDLQHQYFVSLMKQVQKYYEQGSSNLKPREILQEVILYAQYHFYSEENLMKEYGYPDIEKQKAEHRKLIDTILLEAEKIGDSAEDLIPLHTFLLDWFFSHTTKADRQMGKYITKKIKEKCDGPQII